MSPLKNDWFCCRPAEELYLADGVLCYIDPNVICTYQIVDMPYIYGLCFPRKWPLRIVDLS